MAQASPDPCSRQQLHGECGPAAVLGDPHSACNLLWPVEDARAMTPAPSLDFRGPQTRHPSQSSPGLWGQAMPAAGGGETPCRGHRDTGIKDPKGPS